MKRLFFLICLSLIAGAFVFQQTANGGGYVLVSLGNTSVEMSFWTAVLILLGSLLLIYSLVQVVAGLVRAVSGGASRVMSTGTRSVNKRIARGLVEFIEGNWKQARRHLTKTAGRADYPLINYLAAARSSYELGDEEEAFNLLHKAEQVSPDNGLAVALTQARMLLAARKYEQCMANLERARQTAPKHPVVLDLLQQTYRQLEDWRALRKLLPDLRRYRILRGDELDRLERQLHESLLMNTGDKAKLESPDEGVATIETEWHSVPGPLKKEAELYRVYVEQLLKIGAESTVETHLRKELKRHWDEELVLVYGRVKGNDVRKQLLTAEQWQQERPGNGALLLTLGRLSQRNLEWQKAREYLESSVKLRKDPETCAELARLLAHLGEHEQSTHYYQMGLLTMTAPLPDLPLPEEGEPAPAKLVEQA